MSTSIKVSDNFRKKLSDSNLRMSKAINLKDNLKIIDLGNRYFDILPKDINK